MTTRSHIQKRMFTMLHTYQTGMCHFASERTGVLWITHLGFLIPPWRIMRYLLPLLIALQVKQQTRRRDVDDDKGMSMYNCEFAIPPY